MLWKYIEHCLDNFVFSNIPNQLEVSINGRFHHLSVCYWDWEFLIRLAQGNLIVMVTRTLVLVKKVRSRIIIFLTTRNTVLYWVQHDSSS
jgi:hypothetical protein